MAELVVKIVFFVLSLSSGAAGVYLRFGPGWSLIFCSAYLSISLVLTQLERKPEVSG